MEDINKNNSLPSYIKMDIHRQEQLELRLAGRMSISQDNNSPPKPNNIKQDLISNNINSNSDSQKENNIESQSQPSPPKDEKEVPILLNEINFNPTNVEVPIFTMPKTTDNPKKRKYFQPDEDDKIIEGVQLYGNNWSKIVNHFGLDRTPNQLKNRHKRISKKISTQSSPTPSPTNNHNNNNNNNNNIISLYNNSLNLNNSLNNSIIEDSIHGLDDDIKEEKSTDTNNQEIQDLKKKCQMMEEMMRQIEKSYEEKFRSIEKQYEDKVLNMRRIICENIIESSKAHSAKLRLDLSKSNLEIGIVEVERVNFNWKHIWKHGTRYRELEIKKKVLEEEKIEIENSRKNIREMKKVKSENSNPLLIQEKEEIIKLKALSLKKQEADLLNDLNKYEIDVSLHQREIKRVKDEEDSRFNNFPVLHNGRYLLTRLLGKGGFSEVFLGYDLNDLRYVACKIHSLNPHWTETKKENYRKHSIREAKIHCTLEHERIVTLYDVFEIDATTFCTVMEYSEGNDLDFYLKIQKQIPEKDAKSIIAQLCRALRYLHERKNPIIHYDLKPGNIMFNKGEIKLTDFGLSKIVDNNEGMLDLTSQGAGTYWYLPPETFEIGKEAPKISPKVDIWSLGVIFYQILFGKKPFGDKVEQQKILSERLISIESVVDFPKEPAISDDAKDFIRKCLTPNQHTRPDIVVLWEHPYLKSTKISRSVRQSK